ncbi:MAG: putative long chain fatty acid CoA ligase, partial [Akkermansiaceae bacterium]|nr:putative long chain fatty acid CoA ligase [Akkermansiaceae bacterium]
MQELPLIARARDHRDRIAIRSGAHQDHRYRELLEASALLAFQLLAGAADLAEARIAFMAPAGFAWVVMQWAIWRAGGIAIPLALSATRPEIEYVLSDSQA